MTTTAPDYDDGYDRWWVCTRPNCFVFFDNHSDRDTHSASCPGCEEIPF